MIPVTIWGSLGTANQIAGGVLVIDPGTLKPAVDANNFAYLSGLLYLNAGGNFTQNSQLNFNGWSDAYSPSTSTSGHKVSVSKGTALAQLPCTGTEQIGQFEGFAYYNYKGASSGTYQDVCGFRFYVAPTTANSGNLGGRIAIALKGDGVDTIAEQIEFSQRLDGSTQVYNFKPINDGGSQLGAPGAGFEKFYPQGMGNTAPVGNAQTINKIAGKFKLLATTTSVVITNSKVTVNSIVLPVQMTTDATVTQSVIVPAAGSFTLSVRIAPTVDVTYGFFVVSQD